MAVFAVPGQTYVAHILMMVRPHNEQLVAEVLITDQAGEEVEFDSANDGSLSLRARGVFSLDDLVQGKRDSYAADLFHGNFEAPEGTLLLSDVYVTIRTVFVARNLGGPDFSTPDQRDHILIRAQSESVASSFLLNLITNRTDIQQIAQIELAQDAPALPQASLLRLDGNTRLPAAAGTNAHMRWIRAGLPPDSAAAFGVSVERELWRLQGPDFFLTCH